MEEESESLLKDKVDVTAWMTNLLKDIRRVLRNIVRNMYNHLFRSVFSHDGTLFTYKYPEYYSELQSPNGLLLKKLENYR